MGVTGLLPFLKKSTDQVNVRQFSGMTAAIDAYVWLHRGAFSCADRLAQGEATTSYIYYGIKMINMLLSYNIKPILVFDGRRLEAKKDTEIKRFELRKQCRQKADDLIRAGRENEARDYLRRSVDISHLMAVELIKAARKMKVDCIVAPHEADAQLAYLNRQGIAQFVITEDSDLILFGCSQIVYKLDINGNGLLLRLDRLHLTLGQPHQPAQTHLMKLRQMCILSGCDYVNSLPGVGLVKAKKFVMATTDPDFGKSVKRLPTFLNLRVKVDDEYVEKVLHADLTFRRQLVFDPRTRKQLALEGEEVSNDEPYSGVFLDPQTALNLSVGNLDPSTLQKVDNFDPDTLPQTSIWHKDFVPTKPKEETRTTAFVVTKGKEIIVETKKLDVVKKKQEHPVTTDEMDNTLIALYSSSSSKRVVAKTEIKTCIFDGMETRQVVKSSYFMQDNVESKMLSPCTKQQSKTEITPKKFALNDLIEDVPSPSPSHSQRNITPVKHTSSQIMELLDQSPSKLNLQTSPLSRNPFAKKTTKETPAEISIDSGVSISDDCDDELKSGSESLTQGDIESLLSSPSKSLTQDSGIEDIPCSQSSDTSYCDSSNKLDRFRYKRPLFKKTTGTEPTNSPVIPKSPVFGKRKINENVSPSKKKTIISCISKLDPQPLTPAVLNATTSSCSNLGASVEVKRSLTSVFKWERSQESRVEITSKPSPSSRLVGLRKVTKKICSQSSLYKFGFTKK